MPFNVSTFKTQFSSSGYLSTNKFQLIVTPPTILQNMSFQTPTDTTSSADLAKQLSFRVEAVIAPSISLLMMDVNRYGVGVTQKQPVNAVFNTMTLTFISDGYGELWNFWNEWMQGIFGFSGTNNSTTQQNGLINSPASYTLKYKSDYSTTITLVIFDQFGNVAQTIDYNQAYPYTISDIPLNWGETNQLLKINIGIAFTDFVIVGGSSNPTAINTQPPSNL